MQFKLAEDNIGTWEVLLILYMQYNGYQTEWEKSGVHSTSVHSEYILENSLLG